MKGLYAFEINQQARIILIENTATDEFVQHVAEI